MASAPAHETAPINAPINAHVQLVAARFRAQVDGLVTATKALGAAALQRVGKGRKGAAPPPPAAARERRDTARRAAAEGLGTFLVDLRLEELRRAGDAFCACVAAVARAIEEAEVAREAACAAAHPALVAALGAELVADALGCEPTARRTVDGMAKRALLDEASLAAAVRCVGEAWTRDPTAASGKLVIVGETHELVVDVAFATFRLRDRATRAWCDATGRALDALDVEDGAALFARTHFRVAP